jgi:hypothetical protein
VPRETGKELVVRVHYDEGVANHIGPEPCGFVREGEGAASVEDRIGLPLSRESYSLREPTACEARKATRTGALLRAPVHSARSETQACMDAPCAGTGRSHRILPAGAA